MANTERDRLTTDPVGWKRWGPYLSERAWGTVREDYSATGDAWDYFPHEQAQSRTYRWSEDGLGGICDDQQVLCFAFAFWNTNDSILKERIFGLTGPQGNHGEDAKEYWWYLDSTPTHSFMRWRYIYPQRAFPYQSLVEENHHRSRLDPEYELCDTGIFDESRFFDITVDYAKAGPEDICIRLRARNAGPDDAPLHVLPTLWFRNTWSWYENEPSPTIVNENDCLVATHQRIGAMTLSGDGSPQILFCNNESNNQRLWGTGGPSYPKDGIADHVIGNAESVNPAGTGTKSAFWYQLTIAAGETAEIRLRLSRKPRGLGSGWSNAMDARASEADQFYDELFSASASAEDRLVARRACAGMLWTKQYYSYNIARWLSGDPSAPPPPEERLKGRNATWLHVDATDVISMPDKWEYPWFAAWDLAFHCVSLAHLDAEFAKSQLLLICREWYMHPSGQLPAYEWNFSDVNPPVHAWAALKVFEIDGSRDFEFLKRIFAKLLLNFTWWVNRKDAAGDNIFEGGFLGLDNIGPIDRSSAESLGILLEQSDGTAWMAMFCLNLWEIALVLASDDPSWEDMTVKFFEHFAYIATAMYDKQLWDEQDGFFYDVMLLADGEEVPLRVKSFVGLLPLCATMTLGQQTKLRLPFFSEHLTWFLQNKTEFADRIAHEQQRSGKLDQLFSIVDPERLKRILHVMLDESEFLSPYGLRSLSAAHRSAPFSIQIGELSATVDYEPAESTTPLFGGNSNWRGPIWFPSNYLLIAALRRFHQYLGDDFVVEMPTGSGKMMHLGAVANELSRRLVSLFTEGEDRRRPVFGDDELFQTNTDLHDLISFNEYFNGDTGKGLGASHQTGWTGLVADLIIGS